MEKAVREECTLRALALHAVCGQQATLDAALLQDVLSLLPVGSHRVSPTAFVDLSEAADGTRTAEVGSITQIRDAEGRLVEMWCVRGQLHRQDGPAWQVWDSEGRLVGEMWWVCGQRHREDGPAWRKWDSAGRLVEEEWCMDNVRHREGGPAWQRWNSEGRLVEEEWRVRGQLHRDDGPAWQKWNSEGRLIEEEWCAGGELTEQIWRTRDDKREDGP
jgi:YD repeat-containing protein